MTTQATSPTQPADEAQIDDRLCRHTGLSKPECHCQHCLDDLVARFRPGRAS